MKRGLVTLLLQGLLVSSLAPRFSIEAADHRGLPLSCLESVQLSLSQMLRTTELDLSSILPTMPEAQRRDLDSQVLKRFEKRYGVELGIH